MELNSLPDRQLRLEEVRAFHEHEAIKNAEALFYEGETADRSSVIGVFLNIQDTGYLLGFDVHNGNWNELSTVDDEDDESDYDMTTDSVVGWFNDLYGEDGYGVFGSV